MNTQFDGERRFPAFLTLSWAWHESMEDPAAVSAALARNLRRHREQRGLSHKALAQGSGVSLAAIREMEAGRSLPEIATLWRLADALGVSCAALVEYGVSLAAASPQRIHAGMPAGEPRAALG